MGTWNPLPLLFSFNMKHGSFFKRGLRQCSLFKVISRQLELCLLFAPSNSNQAFGNTKHSVSVSMRLGQPAVLTMVDFTTHTHTQAHNPRTHLSQSFKSKLLSKRRQHFLWEDDRSQKIKPPQISYLLKQWNYLQRISFLSLQNEPGFGQQQNYSKRRNNKSFIL